MYSYHRVLAVFGRSVKDKTVECDCDIHPWEIEINGEQWPGRIRLVGFVDVFFVFAYSSNARFERGIVIYKDRNDLRGLLTRLNEILAEQAPAKDSQKVVTDTSSLAKQKRRECNPDGSVSDQGVGNDEEDEDGDEDEDDEEEGEDDDEEEGEDDDEEEGEEEIREDITLARERQAKNPRAQKENNAQDGQDKNGGTDSRQKGYRLTFTRTGRYKVKSYGHEIELRRNYPYSCIRGYNIKISKPHDRSVRRGIKRGLKEHSTRELMGDMARCGFVTHAELMGQFFTKHMGGGVFHDTLRKYGSGLANSGHPGDTGLSNE